MYIRIFCKKDQLEINFKLIKKILVRLEIFYIISRSVGPLAQSVEQLTFNQLVERSNRSRPTIYFIKELT